MIEYNRTNWRAGREGGTAQTPERLNNIEQGIVDLVDKVNTDDEIIEGISNEIKSSQGRNLIPYPYFSANSTVADGITFTSVEHTEGGLIRIHIDKNTTVENVTFYPMLEEGEVRHKYEPTVESNITLKNSIRGNIVTQNIVLSNQSFSVGQSSHTVDVSSIDTSKYDIISMIPVLSNNSNWISVSTHAGSSQVVGAYNHFAEGINATITVTVILRIK